MPRYLVTLRHAETGETKVVSATGLSTESAMFNAMLAADAECDVTNDEDFWQADHACPADDEPVPFRDR